LTRLLNMSFFPCPMGVIAASAVMTTLLSMRF
jgi:hypothetical protein